MKLVVADLSEKESIWTTNLNFSISIISFDTLELKDYPCALHKKHILVQRHLRLVIMLWEKRYRNDSYMIAIIFSNYTRMVFKVSFYTLCYKPKEKECRFFRTVVPTHYSIYKNALKHTKYNRTQPLYHETRDKRMLSHRI